MVVIDVSSRRAAFDRDFKKTKGIVCHDDDGPGPTSHLNPDTFKPLLKKLVAVPNEFTLEDIGVAFQHLTLPDATTPGQIGAFLTALKLTGLDHQAGVIAACANVLLQKAVPLELQDRTQPICDIVGTGGDGMDTFNVSTAAAIIAAGAGCTIAKHGNRASSSASGSADILLAASCPVTSLPPRSMSSVIACSKFSFLFAPNFYPAIAHVSTIRRQLGMATIFNILAPLINPAHPDHMVIGVYSKDLGKVFAEALVLLGMKRAWVVHGAEGLDELSPAGLSYVWEVQDDEIIERTVTPAVFGLQQHALSSVSGGNPSDNSVTLKALLAGELSTSHPVENFVVMNASALLLVSGIAKDEMDGVRLARESISQGKAEEALATFRAAAIQFTQ